jgi:hypothetical protein
MQHRNSDQTGKILTGWFVESSAQSFDATYDLLAFTYCQQVLKDGTKLSKEAYLCGLFLPGYPSDFSSISTLSVKKKLAE